jgi:peptide deformylase
MAILPVIKYGHPTLRQKAASVSPNELDDSFIKDMFDTMEALDGVGLAANQVDVPKQILVAKDPDRKKLYALINPEISAFSERTESDIEGCLSLPGLQARVARPSRIIVRAQSPQGEKIEIEAKGIFARVLQHEIDHLNGVLYIDRAAQDSIAWVIDDGSDDLSTEPATLAEIQRDFRKRYHAGVECLSFEVPDLA